jgi:hypothetical protein
MNRAARLAVPAAVTTAFVAAIVAGPLLPRSGGLPSAALGTTWLLYGLRTVAIFYGLLLLVIPLIRALRGELPIELSMRGARYAETGSTATAVDELRERVTEWTSSDTISATSPWRPSSGSSPSKLPLRSDRGDRGARSRLGLMVSPDRCRHPPAALGANPAELEPK